MIQKTRSFKSLEAFARETLSLKPDSAPATRSLNEGGKLKKNLAIMIAKKS